MDKLEAACWKKIADVLVCALDRSDDLAVVREFCEMVDSRDVYHNNAIYSSLQSFDIAMINWRPGDDIVRRTYIIRCFSRVARHIFGQLEGDSKADSIAEILHALAAMQREKKVPQDALAQYRVAAIHMLSRLI